MVGSSRSRRPEEDREENPGASPEKCGGFIDGHPPLKNVGLQGSSSIFQAGYNLENPTKIRMMTGGTPMTQETSTCSNKSNVIFSHIFPTVITMNSGRSVDIQLHQPEDASPNLEKWRSSSLGKINELNVCHVVNL